MKKVLFTAILGFIITPASAASAFQPNAVIPHFELLTPGVTRSFNITHFNNFPQDFSFFLVVVIGYGPFTIELTTPADGSEGDLFVISGVANSPAGTKPFLRFGRSIVNLSVGIEIGNERNPHGIVWFSSWIASPLEAETTYSLDIAF